MKNVKKILIRFGYGVIGLCALGAVGWFMPFPIEGNWIGGMVPGCGCEYHSFLRFEDGKLLSMPGHHFPLEWVGTYQKKGWGRYEVEWFNSSWAGIFSFRDNSLFVRSAFLRARWENLPEDERPRMHRLIRDPSVLACRALVNNPENDWVASKQGMSYRVMGTPEGRWFLGRHVWASAQDTKEDMVNRLNDCFQSLQIYTAGNEVPYCIIDTLVQNGVDYCVHPNQQWILPEWASDPYLSMSSYERPKEMKVANPIWTNGNSLIIIRAPPDEDLEGDTETCFFAGHMRTFWRLRSMIGNRGYTREALKNHLYLYAENGVLPEDVRQLLEPFGLNYHVLDEKILYRGKQKK